MANGPSGCQPRGGRSAGGAGQPSRSPEVSTPLSVATRVGRRHETIAEPAGTRGFNDLRRKAERVHRGQRLRPRVAAVGDLVRMLEALGRSEDVDALEAMRRVVELER